MRLFRQLVFQAFTFHYVSILIHTGSVDPPWSGYLYIPLCLYFNCPTADDIADCWSLYIPLCLYFNLIAGHDGLWCLKLYIPLCLYFNPEQNRHPDAASKIYIPLCLYFNHGQQGTGTIVENHLHSIMSLF